MSKLIPSIEVFFNAIRNNKIDRNQIDNVLRKVTNDFETDKLKDLLKNFEVYVTAQKQIRGAGLSFIESYRKDNELHGIEDVEFLLCKNFISYLKQRIESNRVVVKYSIQDVFEIPTEEVKQIPDSVISYNTQVFSSPVGAVFFEALLEKFTDEIEKNALANLSYIYRCMLEDGYLHNITPTVFRNFLGKAPYNIVLDKLKTKSDSFTSMKERFYKDCRDDFPLIKS